MGIRPLLGATGLGIVLLASTAASAGLRDELSERRGAKAAAALQGQLLADLAYGEQPRQRLDVYRPRHATRAPMLLMVHGGAWAKGDKRMARVVENKLARWLPQGYVFVSLNYRLLPEADPLQQVEDIARALSYVQRQAASWGGDPQRLVLLGHSAGAHLVSLLSADTAIARRHAAQPWLATVALDSAAFDVEQIMRGKHYRLYDRAFGGAAKYWRVASPYWRLQPGAVPMLAVCSSLRLASCPQAEAFAARAKDLGVRVDVLPQALEHDEINQQLGVPGSYTDAVEAFLRRVGAVPAA